MRELDLEELEFVAGGADAADSDEARRKLEEAAAALDHAARESGLTKVDHVVVNP